VFGVRSINRALVLACVVVACGGLFSSPPASGQEPDPPADSLPPPPRPDTIPSDTYADEGARYMIQRAHQARGTEAAGLASFGLPVSP